MYEDHFSEDAQRRNRENAIKQAREHQLAKLAYEREITLGTTPSATSHTNWTVARAANDPSVTYKPLFKMPKIIGNDTDINVAPHDPGFLGVDWGTDIHVTTYQSLTQGVVPQLVVFKTDDREDSGNLQTTPYLLLPTHRKDILDDVLVFRNVVTNQAKYVTLQFLPTNQPSFKLWMLKRESKLPRAKKASE